MTGTLRPFKLTAMGHAIVIMSLLLLLVMACSMNGQHSAVAFSEESMKDLSRLPHFQRHWLQRVDQQAITKRNLNAKLTTALPSSTTTTTTTTATLIETTDDSLEEVTEKDERVTTSGPSLVSGQQPDAGMDRSTPTLTISEAKQRLKARKIKSRKIKTAVMQLKEEDDGHHYKKAETHLRDEKEEAVEVKKHIQRMVNASCSIPAARLVYVRQQHEASPNVRYLPACTWLHRCSDEVGCCTDDSKTCSASHIESVSLPFFVLTMTGTETKRTMTRLSFENHTACECVGRNSDVMPRTEPYSIADEPGHRPSSSSLHDGTNSSDEGKHHHENSKKTKGVQLRRHDNQRGYHQLGRVATARSPAPHLLFQQRDQESFIEEESTSESSHLMVAKRRLSHAPFQTRSFNYSTVNQCRCPSGYTPVGNGNRKRTTCIMCQCYDDDNRHHRHRHHNNNRAKWSSSERTTRQPLLRCGRLKRGLDFFSARDRGCIIEKKCGAPECDYGRYLELAGRCPRRNELRPTSVSDNVLTHITVVVIRRQNCRRRRRCMDMPEKSRISTTLSSGALSPPGLSNIPIVRDTANM